MLLVSSCICLCLINWCRVLSREWRCRWSSADRRCSNYTWVINNFVAYYGAIYIRGLTVLTPTGDALTTPEWSTILLATTVLFILEVWRYKCSSASKQFCSWFSHCYHAVATVAVKQPKWICINGHMTPPWIGSIIKATHKTNPWAYL